MAGNRITRPVNTSRPPPPPPLPVKSSPRVFISYSNADRSTADLLLAKLEEGGCKCWIAPRDIPGGSTWAESIIKGIEGSKVLLVIVSKSSNTSTQVLRELERAVAKRLAILPILIEKISLTPALEYYLGATHWLDAAESGVNPHVPVIVSLAQSLLSQSLTHIGLIAPPAYARQRRMLVLSAFGMSCFGVGVLAGWLLNRPTALIRTQELADDIQKAVAPQAWASGGGIGSINASEGLLAVRACYTVRREVERHLHVLRMALSLPVRTDRPHIAEVNSKPENALSDQNVTLENFDQIPLCDVLDIIKNQFKLAIVFDNKALNDAGVLNDTLVTINARSISLYLAMDELLRKDSLSYFVRAGAIVITTRAAEETLLETDLLDVSDIVAREIA